MKEKAFSYLRVSGRGQIDGDGFPRQRATIEQYARTTAAQIVEEFTDGGVSGTRELADREGLAALLERVDGGDVKLVIVERADRLARDLMMGELILDQFRKAGARVIAADGGGDLTAADGDPTRVLIRQVLGAVSQFEKSVIVAKLRAARERKRRQHGRCEGVKPYGTLPGENVVLERILTLRRGNRGRRRLSFQSISEQLNAEGMPTRNGGPWRAATIHKIVKAARPRLTAAG